MKIHELVQGSDEWAAFRLAHHGASEAAAMLGLSKKTTRSELLHMKHTGTPKEFSDWVQKNILDYGHEVEAMARPIIEELIGEDLYPVTCSNEDEGSNLSASCDGLTMLCDTAFEHKQWNEALAASVRAGLLPDEHMPQCQQIMLVTGASRVIFVVSDGTPDNLAWVEVRPDPGWFDRIRSGWAQFDRDLGDYNPPEAAPVIVADPVQALPAVSVQVSGQIDVRDNFKVFETALRDFLDNKLIREPQTDQDFADLDLQIKAMKKAEETLNAAESMMLAQIQSVDEAKRQKDMLTRLVRDNRLMAEKLLENTSEAQKAEKVADIRFPEPAPCGRTPIMAKDISKAYGSNIVFAGVNLAIDKGSRVVILGYNGAGKTTTLRLLAHIEEPDTGSVEYGHGCKIGYFAQEHDTLDLNATVLENLQHVAPELDNTQARSILGSFLFSGDDAMKPAHVLSGGEKTRLALATLVTSRANVLLLDEPTNNLDPASREEILKAIAKYEGAIVLVTHDEGAVEALNPERVLLMPDGDEDLWNDSYLELVAEE